MLIMKESMEVLTSTETSLWHVTRSMYLSSIPNIGIPTASSRSITWTMPPSPSTGSLRIMREVLQSGMNEGYDSTSATSAYNCAGRYLGDGINTLWIALHLCVRTVRSFHGITFEVDRVLGFELGLVRVMPVRILPTAKRANDVSVSHSH